MLLPVALRKLLESAVHDQALNVEIPLHLAGPPAHERRCRLECRPQGGEDANSPARLERSVHHSEIDPDQGNGRKRRHLVDGAPE